MRHQAAIGINHNFAPGEPRVRRKSAENELPGWIDENFNSIDGAENRSKKMFDKSFADLLLCRLLRVLCRTECRQHFPMIDRHLRFPIRSKKGKSAIATDLLELARERIGQDDTERQKLRRLIGRVAVHD